MTTFLRSTLYPGQFSSELAAIVRTIHGRELSLFAPKSEFEFAEPPTESRPVEGWVRVLAIERQRDLVLVRLPRVTLENGQYITVSAGCLKGIPDNAEVAAVS